MRDEYEELERRSSELLLDVNDLIVNGDYNRAIRLLFETGCLRTKMAEIQFSIGEYTVGERDWSEGVECFILANWTGCQILHPN